MDEAEARTMLRELDDARSLLRELDTLKRTTGSAFQLGYKVYDSYSARIAGVCVPEYLKKSFISQLEEHAKQTLAKYGKTR